MMKSQEQWFLHIASQNGTFPATNSGRGSNGYHPITEFLAVNGYIEKLVTENTAVYRVTDKGNRYLDSMKEFENDREE